MERCKCRWKKDHPPQAGFRNATYTHKHTSSNGTKPLAGTTVLSLTEELGSTVSCTSAFPQKLIESKVEPYKDASRSEQHEVERILIAGGELNADIYRRTDAIYGEHCLGRTSWNSWCKSFREEQQTISDLHDSMRPASPVKPRQL
ncbi:hypothetical protein TNCV_4526981 [Trichonephila clavipes]|nr:hypothetical protein TNCV_4526981 [Trichonephila clavipes]